MFTLTVTEKGQKDQVYTLDGEINIIGRLKSNSISLNASYGISREHLKITPVDQDSWKVECISHLGGLIFNEREVSECIVKNNDSFFLQNYIFTLCKVEKVEKKELHSAIVETPLNEISKEITPSEFSESQEDISADEDHEGPDLPFATNEESSKLQKAPDLSSNIGDQSQLTESLTVIPQLHSHLKPYLVISLSEEEEDQVIELSDKELWVVGRDPSSDICIEDINISRHHFKIKKKGLDFFIEDLGSSNGTSINKTLIKPQTTQPLSSGDIISVLNIEIYFEIRNVNFKKKEGICLPVKSSAPSDSPLLPVKSLQGHLPQHSDHPPFNAPAVIPNAVLGETVMTAIPGSKTSKKRPILILLILLILGGGFFLLSNNKQKVENLEDLESVDTGTFESLTDEEKENTKSLYILAQQQYQMKKFELCNQTLEQLHSIVAFYQESQDLITTCQSGAESVQIQLEIENQKKQEEQERRELRKIVSNCKSRFNSFRNLEELEQCLSEAITIDPEDEELNILTLDFETQETNKKQRAERLLNIRNQVQKETSIYNQAKKLKDNNQLLKSIPAYKSFLLRKHPSSMKQLVQTAQEELSEMQETIQSQKDSLINNCQALMDSKRYKEAYQICQNVFTVSPNNKQAGQAIETAMRELHKKLKPLFNESVINESLGQVEIAKKQWGLIIEQDIPNGRYSSKAQKKLSKY